MSTFEMISPLPVSSQTRLTAKRRLLQMHYEAGVGHIGGNLSSLDALLVLLNEFVRPNDEFVLSKGHSAGALYVALWSCGRLSEDSLKTFHKDATLLAGHPPAGRIDGIPFATGSLGHGASLAAGIALGGRFLRKENRVFCVTSDGEWQEGSTWEALIFACHHKLNNLKIFVDHNELQGFGDTTSVASMAPLAERISGFDAHVTVIDGHDLNAIREAASLKCDTVHVVIMKTVKGSGVSFMENQMKWHYLPLNDEQYKSAMLELESP
jgi:transketolase